MTKKTKKNNRIINLDTAAGGGNPSSLHHGGAMVKKLVENSRILIASLISGQPDEIIFTSGGTEANNLAIFGVMGHRMSAGHSMSGSHIITTKIEHASILEPCRELARRGCPVTYLPINRDGLVSPVALAEALRPETVLVSIGYANNEIGVIQPIRELAKVIRHFRKMRHRMSNILLDIGCLTPYFHTDACQAPRFLDCRVSTLGVDLMTLNSGKIYGPEGVGCLYVRRGVNLSPLIYGGGQERGIRNGTENVKGIVGFADALALCVKLREKESARLTKLRDYFIDRLLKLPGVVLNGSRKSRLPNNVNVSFIGADSESVVLNLDAQGVYVSSGSACSTHTKDSSYVVQALGYQPEAARSAVRFTLDRATTKRDLDYVLKILPAILKRVML